jgi:hypothetical protein
MAYEPIYIFNTPTTRIAQAVALLNAVGITTTPTDEPNSGFIISVDTLTGKGHKFISAEYIHEYATKNFV